MNTKFTILLATAGTIMLSGCFGGSSSGGDRLQDGLSGSGSLDEPELTNVMALHASSDAPAVKVRMDEDTVVSGADYKQAAVLTPNSGPVTIAIDGILPGGDTVTVIESSESLQSDRHYDVIAVGKVGDDTIQPLILEDDGVRTSSDSVRLRVVHLSPDAETAASGAVDVYVTEAGTPLPADETFTFAFKESFGPIEVPAGDYQIRVTPEGSPVVVYDSGALPLEAGSDLLVGAVDNTVAGASPVSLLAIDGATVTEVVDANAGSGIRSVHNSADAGPVDLFVNAAPGTDLATVGGVQFTETVPAVAALGGYVELEAGENQVIVTAALGIIPLIDETLDLALGERATAIAAGTLADNSIAALVFADDNRSLATAAKLRVIHGAFEAQVVDVYLIPTDPGGAGATEINSAEPALDDFEFGDSSGYLQVAAGEYVVFITTTDGSQLLKTGSISLSAGGIYTAIARLAPEDVANVAGLTLLDDFVVP